ncbi:MULTISPECIES: prolyl-tRNA synthetase associated domain-containing protein [Rhodomicrobium]|uniref:prolyl-tRNA synthetase associated domain-containing protein n=1 Tax=Rhodomicrobium TaxID=1068 RepID=UPI000B4B8AEB|nr:MULTISPECIES: prolyl-tRNA synthetase associated domain-containing protein [Rhodomicrobium]
MAWTREQLLAHLADLGIEAETIDHPAVFTVGESSALLGEIPGAHTKNLFLKCKKGNLFLVTALHETPVDLKTLPAKLGSGRLSFANAELMGELLGIMPGSVSTFAIINDTSRRVSVVLDQELMRYDRINLHPLVNTATTGISRESLISFLKACGREPKILALH